MKGIYIFIVLSCFTLIRCTNSEIQKQQEIDWTGKEISLSNSKEITVPIHPFETETSYQLIDDQYFFATISINQNQPLFVYQLQGDSLIFINKITQKGDGPLDMPNSSYIHQIPNKNLILTSEGYNPQYFILEDGDRSKLSNLNLWTNFKYPSKETGTMAERILPLSEFRLLVKTVGDVPYPFAYFNRGDSTLTYYPYPFPETEIKFSNAQKSVMYSGRIYKHPSQNKILNTFQDGMYACILDISENNIKPVKHLYNELPEYTPDKDGANSSPKRNNKLGFSGISVTEKYIYVKKYNYTIEDIRKDNINNGYPIWFDNIIYVFDWEGNPVKKYNLDKYISSFEVDSNDKFIYAQTIDSTGELCSLIKYEL